MTYQLAQINIARLVAPLDDPKIAGFVEELDSINALAERSPGFVWRLKSSTGNATDIPFDGDPLTIVNMSVWESVESLRDFTYTSRHVEVFRQRAAWFEKPVKAHSCLWWVPAGHEPTLNEGRERLEHYQAQGPTPYAFWFPSAYAAPADDRSASAG
jgi:hypothetical protein